MISSINLEVIMLHYVELPLRSRKTGGIIGKVFKAQSTKPTGTDLRLAIEEKGYSFWQVKPDFDDMVEKEIQSPMWDNFVDIRVLESQSIKDESQDVGFPVTLHRVSDRPFSEKEVIALIQEEGYDPTKVDYHFFSVPYETEPTQDSLALTF